MVYQREIMAGDSDVELKNTAENQIHIDTYRKRVRSYIDIHLYSSALFWADKVVSLSNGDHRDVYWLAQTMYLMKQYHRSVFLLKERGLTKRHLLCKYLAARCLFEAKEFTDALQMLSTNQEMTFSNLSSSSAACSICIDPNDSLLEGFTPNGLLSAICHLKGCVYEALDNRSLAADCYKQALRQDVHCYDAFEALTKHQILTAWEEVELVGSLPFTDQCGGEAQAQLVCSVYSNLLNKYQSMPAVSATSVLHPRLAANLDMVVATAERAYYACAYTQCISITEGVLKKDPYHMLCLPIHVGCLVELRKTNRLFLLAHELVDMHPDLAIAWFAVGCYYYLIGKSDPARIYLGKATTLDRLFGPAWLTYGHSFAADNEHDQAMAAYFKASQLMKGCHLPLLYIGLECGLTNNIKLAEKFFQQAQSIAPEDPFVMHEMGVVAFQNHDYVKAEMLFENALTRVRQVNETMIADKWEGLLNNLGHTCRKLKKYPQALEYHQQALVLSPLNASTLACIGFVQALIGQTAEAVETFHKALGQRRDDTFSTTMLTYVMEQLTDESPPFEGAPDEVPGFETPIFAPRERLRFDSAVTDGSTEVVSSLLKSVGLTRSSSSQLSFEVDMQDSFKDENSS